MFRGLALVPNYFFLRQNSHPAFALLQLTDS